MELEGNQQSNIQINENQNNILEQEYSVEQKQALLRPYKSIGVFTDNKPFKVYSIGNQNYILSPTENCFKIYTLPQIRVQLLSPTFSNKIRAFTALNEFVFIGVKNTIYKMRYYHIISQIQVETKIEQILVLGKFLIVLGEGNIITVIEHNQNRILHSINMIPVSEQEQDDIEYSITNIIHPPTYLNKLLVYGSYHMQIWNIATQQLIFSFNKLLEEFRAKKIAIQCVEPSPVLNIVCVSFSNGQVYFFDIKQDTILFQLKCQFPAISMSFSKQDPPLLACGDEKGNITMWDLNERKKFTTLKEVHSGPVNSLSFQFDDLMLLSGSGQGNEIFQWKYEEISDKKFMLNRKRNGLKSNIMKLRYMDKDHVLACTNHSVTELREFSLLNEGMSQFYSVKQQTQKQMKNKNILTETSFEQNKPVKDFSFSMNRARDWSNVITIHNDSGKPSLFNSEDKSIVKKNIELYEPSKDKKELESDITTAFVSNCGNFGVLGFQNGKIIKFNMQSGKLQKIFKNSEKGHSSTITSVFVNFCNKYLVSTCQNSKMIIWDFFSASILYCHDFQTVQALFLRPASFVDNYIVALTDCTLEIWDTQSQRMGRKFRGHTNRITDACWVENNKQIISAGMDGLLNIFDILSNQLIQSIAIQSNKFYITSLDMCNNVLITSFNNSRQVFLWHNLIDSLYWNNGSQKKIIQFKSLLQYHTNTRAHFFQQDKIKNDEIAEKDNQNLELELQIGKEENNDNLIRFTLLETGKWLPLVYIDEIKERNKLENQEKEEIKMPFFLDFENKDQVKNQFKEEIKSKIMEKSKILNQEKEKYLIELDQGIENIFVKISGYEIMNNHELLDLLQNIKDLIKQNQKTMENKINYITCLSENFAKIPQ